jgi:hypothetical protein
MRFFAVFEADNKGDDADEDQTLEDILDSFNLQTEGTFLAAVMAWVGKFAPSYEKKGTDNTEGDDNERRSFVQDPVHIYTIPVCFTAVNRTDRRGAALKAVFRRGP